MFLVLRKGGGGVIRQCECARSVLGEHRAPHCYRIPSQRFSPTDRGLLPEPSEVDQSERGKKGGGPSPLKKKRLTVQSRDGLLKNKAKKKKKRFCLPSWILADGGSGVATERTPSRRLDTLSGPAKPESLFSPMKDERAHFHHRGGRSRVEPDAPPLSAASPGPSRARHSHPPPRGRRLRVLRGARMSCVRDPECRNQSGLAFRV